MSLKVAHCVKKCITCQGARLVSTCRSCSQSHYDVLEVPKDASPDMIKKSFIEKSKQFHPDRDPGNETMHEKFVSLNEAYTVLMDPKLRAIYNYDLFTKPDLRKKKNSTLRSKGYKNPYKDVKRNVTDWTDYYNPYGGGKARRDAEAESETDYWRIYWEQTRKFGGGGLSTKRELPKSTLGTELTVIVTILVVVYTWAFFQSYNNTVSVDHDSFDKEHLAWLMSRSAKGSK